MYRSQESLIDSDDERTVHSANKSLPSTDANSIESPISEYTATTNLPDWTVHSEPSCHLWNDTNASGDVCYLNEVAYCQNEAKTKLRTCQLTSNTGCVPKQSGMKKKCSSCRITCHVGCISKLKFPCRPTYTEADVDVHKPERISTEGQTAHHWVYRRRLESKCRHCSKAIRPMFPFSTKEAVAIQCSWCKESYHNKPSCYLHMGLTEACGLGMHSSLVIPPDWVMKIPSKNTVNSSIRRTSSLVLNIPSSTRLSVTSLQLNVSTSRPEGYFHNIAQTSVTNDTGTHSSQSPADNSWRPSLQLPFLAKPNFVDEADHQPLLVFLNPKSGGNQALGLIRKFQWLLNPRQVFDLSQNGPELGFELFGRVPNVCALACGGDGTVGWLLSTIDGLHLGPVPPVAVLPLGTGNDLARTLGWGSGYADESISKVLQDIQHAKVVPLDRWKVNCHIRSDTEGAFVRDHDESATSDSDSRRHEKQYKVTSTLPLKVFNNYFSIGADAATALDFHESREAKPEKFNSRLKNKMFYAGRGGRDLIVRHWRDLVEHITLECDGKDLTPLIRSLRPHVLLFLNIPRYGAGTQPWGHSPENAGFLPQQFNDGLIEVIGLSAMSLAALQVGGHGDRICQCRSVILTTDKVIPVQMDGEACRLLPAVIEVQYAKQALVLQRLRGRLSKGSLR